MLQQDLSEGQGQEEWQQVFQARSTMQHTATHCPLQHTATGPVKRARAKRVATSNPG